MKPIIKIIAKASSKPLTRRDLLVGDVALSIGMKVAYMKTSSGGLVRLSDGEYLAANRGNHLSFVRPASVQFNITE